MKLVHNVCIGRGKICLGVLSISIGSLLFIACGGSESEEDEGGGGLVVQQDAGHSAADAGVSEGDAGGGEFISIPAGSYVLSHDVNATSQVFHAGDTVSVQAFSLQKTPVTVAQFEKCVAARACTRSHYMTRSEDLYESCNYDCAKCKNKNHPMNCVDWYGANEYCEWIGGRLPEEYEWEYAATHNGTQPLNTKYPWGDSNPDTAKANFDLYETTAVGKYSPAGDSPLGLVDMSGNVQEWTHFEKVPYTEKIPRLKGGSAWSNYFGEDGCGEHCARDLDITNHSTNYEQPSTMERSIGFRCAK